MTAFDPKRTSPPPAIGCVWLYGLLAEPFKLVFGPWGSFFRQLGAHRMTSSLGTVLIWASWLYVAVAVIAAKSTFRKARQGNPAYFSYVGDTGPDPFKFREVRGLFDLITDNALGRKGFDESIIKRVRIVRVIYLIAPIAFILFFAGIAIR